MGAIDAKAAEVARNWRRDAFMVSSFEGEKLKNKGRGNRNSLKTKIGV
jgi:hypothetical protein